jgi:heme/copper-type cytochrome/quinol oxidase subunit 2
MPKPLRPFNDFLGKTWLCVVLAILPFAILEGMWSEPKWREFARKFDGSTIMWTSFAVWIVAVFCLWCRWVVRSKSRDVSHEPDKAGRAAIPPGSK